MSYRKGENLSCCPVCGKQYYAGEFRKRWDGLWVCHYDYEERHPQDFIRPRVDDMRPAVVAGCCGGGGDESDSEVLVCPVLVSPSNAASDVGIEGVVFEWQAFDGANLYEVFLSENGGEYTSIAITANTFYEYSTPLTYSTSYRWYVDALTERGGQMERVSSCVSSSRAFSTEEEPEALSYTIAVGFRYIDGTIAPTTKFYTSQPTAETSFPLYTDPHAGDSEADITNVCAWSPDGQWFVAGSDTNDKATNVYDGTTLEYIATLNISEPRKIAWSPDSTKLVVAGEVGIPPTLACFDIDNADPTLWTQRNVVHGMGVLRGVDVNSTYVGIASSTAPDFRLYDWATLTAINHGLTLTYIANTIRFNPDETNNEFVVSGSSQVAFENTSVWRVGAGPTLVQQEFGDLNTTSTITGAYALTGNKYLVTDGTWIEEGGQEQSLLVYDATTYELIASVPFVFPTPLRANRGASFLAVSADGKLAAVAHSEYCFSVVDLETYSIVGGEAVNISDNLYFIEEIAIKGGK